MLLRLKIKNFLSFNEETVFDMYPNPKRVSFPNHIYSNMKVPLLKQAALYGANGAGKSNLVKALLFLRNFTTDENFLKRISLDDYFFQLTDQIQDKLSFEIEFYTNGHYLLYAVEIGLQSVSESLSLSGIGKSNDRTVFRRKDTEIKAKFIPNSDSAKKLLEMNNRSSLLPLNQKFPVLPDEEIREAFKWFMEKLVIITVNSTVPALIDIMSHNPELLSFTNELFEKTGVGIQSFKISDTPLDEWMSNHQNFKDIQQIIEQDPLKPDTSISRMENNRNIFAVSLKQGIKTVQEFIFDQMGQDGFHKGMKITAQSDGTVRLLTLIPAIYEAIRHEKVIFVDEIDNSIHPNLLISLLQYFGSTESKGQLIYTTHTTKLINQQELLRPDEIWLIEKKQGNSKLYSINDFKIHNTINLENGYLDGRYGGIPQMGDFFE